jgi:hypothetical protein
MSPAKLSEFCALQPGKPCSKSAKTLFEEHKKLGLFNQVSKRALLALRRMYRLRKRHIEEQPFSV